MTSICTVLAVADIAAARKFYEELFGLEVWQDYGINVSFTCGLALQQAFGWLVGLPEERIVTVVNASGKSVPLMLPWTAPVVRDLLTGRKLRPRDGTLFLTLPPYGGLLLI